jgi:two-component system, probable response regulator PhcQ
MAPRVLLVDDEPSVTEALKRQLRREPYEVLCAASADQAMQVLRNESIDVVVSDERMPGMAGSELLSVVRRHFPDTVRMVLTGHASLQATLRAINEGQVSRFFIKPCDPAELSVAIRQAIQQRALLLESRRLLDTVRRQAALLRNLGVDASNVNPTEVKNAAPAHDSPEAIDIEDSSDDIEALTMNIKREIETCERYLRAAR